MVEKWTHAFLFTVTLLDIVLSKVVHLTKYNVHEEIRIDNNTLHNILQSNDSIENIYEINWHINDHSFKRFDVSLRQGLCAKFDVINLSIRGNNGENERSFCDGSGRPFFTDTAVVTLKGRLSASSSNINIKIKYQQWCRPCSSTDTLNIGDTRVIENPDFPRTYKRGCACEWHIIGNGRSQLSVKSLVLNLPPKNENGYCTDYIELFMDLQRRKSVGSQFCGNSVIDMADFFEEPMTIVFISSPQISNATMSQDYKFRIEIQNKEKNSLSGLQTVAATIGAISFGIFLCLLLCSVFYKRCVEERVDSAHLSPSNVDPNDPDDVIQAAAPPSYTKVMDSPMLYPEVHHEPPPTTDPPGYLDVQLPSYMDVSESEDDWFSPRHHHVQVQKNLSIVPEVATKESGKNKKSRSERSSNSKMAQSRSKTPSCEVDDEQPSTSTAKASRTIIEEENPADDEEEEEIEDDTDDQSPESSVSCSPTGGQSCPLIDQNTTTAAEDVPVRRNSQDAPTPPTSSRLSGEGYSDLARYAIQNSLSHQSVDSSTF